MNQKQLEKKIDHQRDIKNNLWTGFVLTIAGSIGLSLDLNSFLKLILISIGYPLSILLFIAYFKKDICIDNLINKMNEDNE